MSSEIELNRQLIILLGVAFCVLCLIGVIVSMVATRQVIRANHALSDRYEYLLNTQLKAYVELQREENARLVRDTRAATAKMNVMADALWEGLRPTVREQLLPPAVTRAPHDER